MRSRVRGVEKRFRNQKLLVGGIDGDLSGGSVLAAGSDTPRVLADWTALINGDSVINLAAFLSNSRVPGVTDDTAAFNALTDEVRDRFEAGAGGHNIYDVCAVIPPGTYSVSSWDLTGLLGRTVHIVGCGARLTANTPGLNIIDALGSRWLKFYGLKTYSPPGVLALAGLQLGPKGTETCGNNALNDCDFLGHYTRAAYANLASETTYAKGCAFQNLHSSGYAAIGDGFSRFLPESEYVTVTRRNGNALSLTNNRHYSCQFRQEGGGAHAIFACNTQSWAWDSNCYFLSFTGAPFHLYGTSARRNQGMQIAGLFETALNFSPNTGIDYCFELDGDGTGTAIDGFTLDTFLPHCAVAVFHNSGESAYRISGASLKIVGLSESAAVWFDGMSGDSIDGEIWTRQAAKLNLDDISKFTGVVHVNDISGMGMPVDGAYTLLDTTNKTLTFAGVRTSDPAVAGQWWDNAGTLTKSA